MKIRRILFITSLIVLFLVCFKTMNDHYDELSRYQYTNEDNRDLILENLTTEEINYLIERQYKPEEFIRYFGIDDFMMLKLDWYNHAKTIENMKDEQMIRLVNQLSEKMTYLDFKNFTENYTVSQLYDFYYNDHIYKNDLSLYNDFSKNEIKNDETLFTYEPKDLIRLDNIPSINSKNIYLRKDTHDALSNVCKAAYDINEKTCGNMIVVKGYVSYEEQIKIYEDALIKYGIDDVLDYENYPGQSEYQFGNLVVLIPTGVEDELIEITDQQLWIQENINQYGFELLNDSDELLTKFILKYVGLENLE